MPLLIDGHNLIGKLPDLQLSDPKDEDKLIARLKKYVARSGKRVTVVFDPPKHSEWFAWSDDRYEQRNLEIIFATMGRSADDVIRERVAAAKDKVGLVLVTSDAAVANFARQCGVKTVRTSEEFGRELQESIAAPKPPPEKPVISQAELDEWMKVFKEPTPTPKPPPATPPIDSKEAKRLRRMEQLKKQIKGGKRLS